MLDKVASTRKQNPNLFAMTRFIPTPCLPKRIPAGIADTTVGLVDRLVSFRDMGTRRADPHRGPCQLLRLICYWS